MATCSQCGASIDANILECKYCGAKIEPQANQQQAPIQYSVAPPQPNQQYAPQPQVIYVQNQLNDGIDSSWPIKSKIAAGVLAILLGGLGVHKFYMGKIGLGIIYLLFFWTYIPALISLVEGIIYLTSSDHNFQVKNKVRIA